MRFVYINGVNFTNLARWRVNKKRIIMISYSIPERKETCTLVILVYRTCENRVDENPAFSHDSYYIFEN